MLVTLQHGNGNEENVDVDGILLTVDGCPLEISPGRSPSSIVLNSPGDEKSWHQLIISPGAANVIHVEVVPHVRRTAPPPD